MKAIRAVIVDDEDLARERIRTLLADSDDVALVGEYERGADALRELAQVRPDLLFLDVQMPGIDGFSMLEAIPAEHRPACVIFVTAYDAHAIRAFDVNAVDYLLKPFTNERFARALDRVRARADEDRAGYAANVASAIESIRSARNPDRIPIKTENGTHFVAVGEIDWAESDGNYVRIHTGKESAAMRETLTRFCERLPAERFVRVHRCVVVNVERIARVEPWAHGEYVIVLRSGAKVKSGRAYGDVLRALLH